jgi:hypothetical protein
VSGEKDDRSDRDREDSPPELPAALSAPERESRPYRRESLITGTLHLRLTLSYGWRQAALNAAWRESESRA